MDRHDKNKDYEGDGMARILVVDDAKLNIKLLEELLSVYYEVFVANNGQKALQQAVEIKPDLILMDVIMPDMSGFTVCRILKNNEATANIPLIFVTSLDNSDEIVKGFEAGGQDYIVKPFNPQELYARVHNHIELKKSREVIAEYATQLEKINVQQKILLNNLEIMASIDPLTGVCNRRTAIERINEEISRYKRNSKIFSFLMVDIDNFKSVNDNYGHEIGDLVIKHVVGTIQLHIRTHDSVFRWGGEEFLILLSETDSFAAYIVAEKIRKQIEDSSLDIKCGIISVTVTIGGAEYKPQIDMDANINRADKALYAGKKKCKNCVVMAQYE